MYYKFHLKLDQRLLTLSTDPVNISGKIQIFINMSLKSKHLIVRITESQFMRLADALITEQKNKSTIVRAALDDYMDGTDKGIDRKNQKNNRNKKILK
jgi:hypothetical protein